MTPAPALAPVAPEPMWSLAEILKARSIAIVGAAKAELSELKLTGRPLKYIRMHGFDGFVAAVNPKYTELDGYPCYPSISAIPDDVKVDVAALMLSKDRIRGVVEECGRRGVKAVVIFSSGFAETGESGVRDQAELVRLAHSYNMRVLGPNAGGLVSTGDNLVLSFLTAFGQGTLPRGKLSLASNSGALLSTGVLLAKEAGIGFSQLGSIGNEADLSLSDFIAAGVRDPGAKVIAAFVESIKNGQGLIDASTSAAAAGKPVVILKIGSSERGGKVAASHTGAITGDDRAISAVFSQLGVTRVLDLTELIDMAGLFSRYEVPAQPAAAIVSTGSGGAAEMMADLTDRYGLNLASFEGVKDDLARLLTPFSILVNPIDIAGVTSDFMEEPRLFRTCMEDLLQRPEIGIFGVVIPVLPYMKVLAQHIIELIAQQPKPIIPILMGGGDFPACVEMFKSAGVPYFVTANQGARGLKLFQAYAEFQARRRGSPPAAAGRDGSRKAKAIALLEEQRRRHDAATLYHFAPILSLYGLGSPRQMLAATADEAARCATEIGFPVVMKVESAAILHKTEMGGVAIGVKSEAEARRSFDELMGKALAVARREQLDGILIQPMVRFHSELILGSTRDPRLGHVMVAGLGGVWVELLQDVAMRLPPVSEEEAWRMLEETKAARLLGGYRGQAPADRAALARAIANFSQLVADLGDHIEEIEINPLFVLDDGKGVVVGDALATFRKAR